MAGYDSAGNYTRWYSWQTDANNAVGIVPDRHDKEDDEFAAALNKAFLRNGTAAATGDFNMNGYKIRNLANAVNTDEAVSLGQLTGAGASGAPTFLKSLSISGTDANGRINFTAATGANGIAWQGADLSWIARLTDTDKERNRLVMNNTYAGTVGSDVFKIDEGGSVTLNAITSNMTIDQNAKYRTPVAGWATQMAFASSAILIYGIDTATTAAWNTVTPRITHEFFTTGGSSSFGLMKASGTTGNVCQLLSYVCPAGGSASLRWEIIMGDASAESGGAGNYSGSNFLIYAADNSGANAKPMFTIDRTSNNVQHYGISLLGSGFYGHVGSSSGYYGNVHNFAYGGSNVLSVYVNDGGWGIAMTACDYRLKQDVAPLDSSWDAIKALKPVQYKYRDFGEPQFRFKEDQRTIDPDFADQLIKADGRQRWGFIAHEVGEVIPAATIGEKDDPKMIQTLDLLPIVAALTKALQEAMARIEALEARP